MRVALALPVTNAGNLSMVHLIARFGKSILDLDRRWAPGAPGFGLFCGAALIVGTAVLAVTRHLNVLFGLNWPKLVWVVAVWAVLGVGIPGMIAYVAASPRGEYVFHFIVGLLVLLMLPVFVASLVLAGAE